MPGIDQLRRSIQKNPSNPDLHFRLGKAHVEVGEFAEAITALDRAVTLAPVNIGYRLLLAMACVKHHEPERAREQYEAVLSSDPSNKIAHMNLGYVFERHLKNRPRAIEHYRKHNELHGEDPRIVKRLQILEAGAKTKSGGVHSGAASANAKAAAPLAVRKRRWFPAISDSRAWLSQLVAEHSALAERLLVALGMLVVLQHCQHACPIGSPTLSTLVCVGLAGLTALHMRWGIALSMLVMFFPIAFHKAGWAYVYAAGSLLLFVAYGRNRPGRLVAVLLTPLLLKLNLAYAVPIGAGLVLGAGGGAGLGVMACVAGLAYMFVVNLHHLGPLALNHADLPPVVFDRADPTAFHDMQWAAVLASLAQLETTFADFRRSVYPALLKPPLMFIQMSAWGVAAYASGIVYRRRTWLYWASALGAATTVFLMQIAIIKNLPGGQVFSWGNVITGLFLSIAVIHLAALFAPKADDTEAGEQAKDDKTAVAEEKLGDISWESIGGLEDVKKEIHMVTQYQFERKPMQLAKEYGLKDVKGILFYGPPGCGKTMFARVLAKELGARFFSVQGSDFRSKWYGESESKLGSLFAKARQRGPSIIFFDEIDTVLPVRGETASSDSPEKGIVATFLSEMDGVKPLHGVMVVGATNEPGLIDPAVMRPGRFDKLIYIPLPDAEGRRRIFDVHLEGKPLADDIDLHALASMTERFSGADIADVCSKVAEQAMDASLRIGQAVKISMAGLTAQVGASKPSVSLKLLRKYEELHERFSRRTLKTETGAAQVKKEYSWEQIGGLERVRKELIEAIEDPLTKPELYEKFGIVPPKGLLIYGPPGCGKTLMAKIVAQQCGAYFLSVDVKKETSESIREWFIRARENKPSILFFDEIDSIATSRQFSALVGQGVVTQLLVELDGTEDLTQVAVLAATNRPDLLDSALMRPGRFDRLVYVPPPDRKSRLAILKIHLRGKPMAADVDLGQVAAKTENYSGADLAAICYEASMNLIRRSNEADPRITMFDLSSAMKTIKTSLTPEELAYSNEMKTRYARG